MKKKNQFKRTLQVCLLVLAGLLLTGMPLRALENTTSLEEHIPGWQTVLPLKTGDISSPVLQGYTNNNNFILRLEGIDDDDNGLGEVPAGDGFFILVAFSMIFIIYRSRKKLFAMRYLYNKRIQFILLLLVFFQSASFAANYYWVGAGGTWSDINHWATTSGGDVKYTLAPTAADDVFFDANSGFTTTNRTLSFGATTCLCRNFSSQGAAIGPTLTGGSGNLEVWGSFYISPQTSLSFPPINFRSNTPGATITTNGKTLYSTTFNGTGGWVLMDAFTTSGTLVYTSGSLDFNGQTVTMAALNSSSSSPRTLNIAGSTINCTQGQWDYTGTGSSVLTNAQTAGSTISIVNGYMNAKAGDKYYNVEIKAYGDYYGNPYYVSAGSYNKVSCLVGNVNISSSSSITTDTLILNANAIFNFTNPTNVNKYFSATPASSCGGQFDLASGTVNMGASGVVNINHARIRNTTISGMGAPYAANNSINYGGNSGWNFLPPTGVTFYWVGGSGNWSDVSHWASTSGGDAGSGCVPSSVDNAIFDDNSGFTFGFNTVSLEVAGYCNDMKWLGTAVVPTFQKASGINPSLDISGSLYLQAGMNFNPYALTFSSDRPTETITSNGVYIPVGAKFKSATGTGGWSFQDAFSADAIRFYRGNLNFNGQSVTLVNDFYSSLNAGDYYPSRTLNIANSTITAAAWTYTGGVTLDVAHSINSLIRVTSNTNYGAGTVAKGSDHYYNLEVAGKNTPVNAGIYNKITYLSTAVNGGVLDGNIQTDTLLFQCSGTFTFNTNIKVNKYLATKETCGGITVLTSNSSSERTITMGNPSQVKVSNAQINAVSITGPGTLYVIPNSIKQGGIDAGWNFGTVAANTFYWVGDAGNWNDQSHWATTSGGTPGSGCIPSPFDNVIFDNNSFSSPGQTVTVDGNAYCDSMSWIGNTSLKPIFSVPNPMQINGSLVLQAGMTVPTGTLAMNSSRANETVQSNGVVCKTLSFTGTGGWTALDSISCKGDIYFSNGNLNFNGQQVRVQNFYSTSTNTTRTLNMANSTIFIEDNNWEVTGGAPITAAQTVNSTIVREKQGLTFKAKAGDVYYNLFLNTRTGLYSSSVSQGTFNRLEFTSPGTLNAVTADSLILSRGGYTYTLAASSTITVRKYLQTNGTPCSPTTIQSSSSTVLANFSIAKEVANVAPDTVLLEFVRIRNLNAVAGPDRAILKKGPQSTDDGDYGASGGNVNWVIVPYVGASGFDGLGPDLAIGCTDLPRTIQLDPVYYAGSVGSYEWRQSSSTGPVIGTTPQLTVNTTGNYYLKVFYDAAKTCSLIDSKIVLSSADSLIWTGGAGTSDWNNNLNWRKADGTTDAATVPRACTDVLIPAGTTIYPSLDLGHTSRSVYPDAACRNIHFASGAEVAYTDSLHYSKAYVDLTLKRDKWYMLSTPLKNMYSGDYWTAPWNVTVASGAAYNRNNPKIYMQQYQMQNPETGYYPGAANWSKAFNTLDISLGVGQGYVTGIDQPGADQTFHFPRPETKLEYFNKTTGLPMNTWTPALNRANAYRMHIEPGFTGIVPVSWDSISRSTIIIGNPLMAHLNFVALQDGNPGVFGNSYYVWTGSAFEAFATAGDQSIKTDWTSTTSNLIAPMQSFIVEKQNPGSLINSININSGMSATAPGVTLRRNTSASSGSLNLAVYRDEVRQSAATLIPAEGKNVTTLFSGMVKEPAVVYFGSKEAPYSIFGSDLEKAVEVGVRTTVKGMLTFRIQGVETLSSGTRIFLEDKLLGTSQDMTNDPVYLFSNETGNIEGRFFLKSVNAATGIEEIVKNPGISIHAVGNTVYVTSADEPVRKIEVFNVQGLLIYQVDKLDRKEHSFSLNAEKEIVVVKVTTGSNTQTEKVRIN